MPGWEGHRLRRLRESTLLQNTLVLYAVHAAGLLLPLVTIPYLARVLRPEGWGVVVFAQSFAAVLTLLLEHGFYLSGTRMIARARGADRGLGEVVRGVQSAKLLLLPAVFVLFGLAYLLVPMFARHPDLLVWACVVALVQGLSPFWFFQGVERMGTPAMLEVGAKLIATVGIFVLVRSPADAWIVLALQGVTGGVWLLVVTGMLYRQVPFLRPVLAAGWSTLRESFGIFVFRGATAMYIQANSFVLGLVAGPQAVAFFGGAERAIRAGVNLLHPASQAIFPRISQLAVHDRANADRLVRWSLLVIGSVGVAMGIFLAVLAPLLVDLLLGPGYEAAVPVMRILALLPPLIAVGTVLGIQWALPMGMDRAFLRLVLTAGVVNLALAVPLAGTYGASGMAASVVIADAIVTAGLIRLAWTRGGSLLRPVRPRPGRSASPPRLGAAPVQHS